MPTVIADDLRFAFLHIPKTGGTTFGQQLAEQVAHDARFYEGIERDEVLGDFYRDHLTMPVYAKRYPDVFEKLRDFDVYAISRDPYARFRSALAEYSRMSERGELSQLSPGDLRAFIGRVMDDLKAGRTGEINMIFFRPQAEYLALDGEMIADRVFDIRALGRFAGEVGEKYGLRIDTEENRRKTPHYDRRMMGRIAGLKRVAERVLPAPLLGLVKSGVQRAIQRDGDPLLEKTLEHLGAKEFARDHYKDDYEIREKHVVQA